MTWVLGIAAAIILVWVVLVFIVVRGLVRAAGTELVVERWPGSPEGLVMLGRALGTG